MRNGFLGVIAILLAGAGMAWAQMGPGDPVSAGQFPGMMDDGYDPGPQQNTSPNIPPNFYGSSEPYTGIGYPPPANWEQFDPNGLPGNYRPPQPARFWTNVEYLLFWSKAGNTTYPIATTGSDAGGGVLSNNSTSVLYDNGHIGYNGMSGFRGDVGYLFDADRRFGVDVGGFFFGQQSSEFFQSSNANGTPLLARPYINSVTGQQDSVVVAMPGASDGYIDSRTTMSIWGLEGNTIYNFYRSFPGDRWGMDLNAILGFRFLDFTETTTITSISNSTNQGGNTNIFNQGNNTSTTTAGGSTVHIQNNQTFVGNFTTGITDQWRVINQFYGGQVGLSGQFRYDRWTVDMFGKVGFGDMHEIYEVAGTTILNTSIGTLTNTGGVLTQATNIGKYSHDTFAVLPEFSIKVGYRLNTWATASIGYNILYISQVSRPSLLINGQADPRLIPAAPQFGFASNSTGQQPTPQTDYWLMGLTFSLNIRF